MACFRVLIVALLLCFSFPASGGDLPRVTPQKVGLSAATMAGLKPALQKLVDEGKIPGGIAMTVRHGKVADITLFGWRDLQAKSPMTEDTIFAIVSMTKPITCVAVMTLVEQGKIGIDDPVSKYIPQFKDLRVLDAARDDPRNDTRTEPATVPAKRPVTIRHLLTHTSGMWYGVFADARFKEAHKRTGVVGPPHETLAGLVANLAKVPLAHQPGEGWSYGFSHDVLGHVIEIASGQRFDRYLQERILAPLDMRDTSFLVPQEKRGRVATIYEAGQGDELTPLRREGKAYGSKTYFSGGGGLFSTAGDYARFAQMMLNGGELDGVRILQPGTVAAMTTNQIGAYSSFGGKYGLGFGLALAPNPNGGEPVLERYYGGGVFSTNFWVVPRRDLVLLLMTQVYPTNQGHPDRVFYRIVNAAVEK